MWRWIILALALCLNAIPAPALVLGHGGSSGSGGSGYVDFCSETFIAGHCVYAFDVQQRMVSTNTVPFTLTRLSDSATHSAAYTGSSFAVNVSDLTGFCLGNGGTTSNVTDASGFVRTVYNDCVYTTVYEQAGSGCDLVAGGPSTLGTTHAPVFSVRQNDNLPVIVNTASAVYTSASAKFLFKNGCTVLDGNVARTSISRGNNAYFSACCGFYGKVETYPPAGLTPNGAMWSVSYYHNGANIDFGADIEGGGACGAPATTPINLTPVIDDVGVITYSATAGGSHTYYNDMLLGPSPCTPFATPNTQDGMVIGCGGDYNTCGPVYFRGMVFLNIDVSLTAGLHTQVYNYMVALP
jgi:hypothetical protein